MKMKEILTLLGGRLLCGAPQDDHEFTSAFASDMMSDVLAYGQGQSLLLTGLLNQQVIRTAEMLDMHCIIFVRGKTPAEEVLTLAREKGIAVISTQRGMFTASGLLYGRRPARRIKGPAMTLQYHYIVPGDDFVHAGEASGHLKGVLRQLGYPGDAIRRVAVSMYEGEINMVIHANGGEIDAEIDDCGITIVLRDQGPGIPDVEKAMQEGWSTASDEIRAQGFGAGMGLPNMKKYTDNMQIDTVLGVGTTISLRVDLH